MPGERPDRTIVQKAPQRETLAQADRNATPDCRQCDRAACALQQQAPRRGAAKLSDSRSRRLGMAALRPFLEERIKRRRVAGVARRCPGFGLAALALALLARGSLGPFQRGAAIRGLLGARSLRKLREESDELVERGRGAKPRPDQVLEPCPREPLGDAAGEAGEMIAEFLGGLARLDEVPVGELLRLGDLLGGQPGDCGEPRLFFLL